MRRLSVILVVVVGLLSFASAASAQTVRYIEEDLEFDRPEAWAMKYFASVTLLSTLAAPVDRPAGSVDASVELTSIPWLSQDQRTVGFHGTKQEDLNKLPVLVRPRVSIALPRDFSVTAAWVPPVGLNGVRANLVSLGLGKTLLELDRWSLGAMLYAQTGTVKGSFTCPEDLEKFDPEGNYGCERPSSDTTTLRYGGMELTGSHRIRALGGPH